MNIKKAKIILSIYKIINFLLAFYECCILVFLFEYSAYLVIPFFPVVFMLFVCIFIVYPIFLKVVYKKSIFYYLKSARKTVKYIIIPTFIPTLMVWAAYASNIHEKLIKIQ